MTGLAVAGTFAAGLVLYPPAIAGLRRLGVRQHERAEGPSSHLAKAGTPTSGGLVFCLLVAAVWGAVLRDAAAGLLVAAAALGVAVGLADDLTKARTGAGIRVIPKFLLLGICSAVLGLGLWAGHDVSQLVPGLGWRDLGLGGVGLAALAALACSNAVNLTDGVDGLTGGCAVPAFAAVGAAAGLQHRPQLAIACWCVCAALLAFLVFNRPRARIIMGDSGSLALGLMLAVAAAQTGLLVLLPLLGAVFLLETASVMLQVGYFKLSHGRRLLRMSPYHHHLELGGISEWGVDARLWAVALVSAAATLGWAVWTGLGAARP